MEKTQKMKINKIFMSTLLLFVVLGGSVFAVSKANNTNPIDYISSITTTNNNDDSIKETVQSEKTEAKELEKLAKITSDEAKIAALAKVNGEVKEIELDNENGNVVYSVEILSAGITVDVKVDAGNGKVLKVETDNESEDNEKDTEKEDGNETDGIDHQFEGDEGDHED